MATLGSIAFDQVTGIIPPYSTPSVKDLPNPALVPATVELPNDPEPATLTYLGWFEVSQKAVFYALPKQVIEAQDETGAKVLVKVKRVAGLETVPALGANGVTAGVLHTLMIEVRAWA